MLFFRRRRTNYKYRSESTISTSDDIVQIQNDLSKLGAPIGNSISELKNDSQEIVKTIEQRSIQIVTDISQVDRNLINLNQNVNTLGGNLSGNMSRLEHKIEHLSCVWDHRIEDKILNTLNVYFNRQSQSSASQPCSVNTMVKISS